MTQIHPTALVDSKAELDSSVSVGPFTTIGPNVRLGANTRIGSHCVIEGHTTIGQNNQIWAFNSIGGAPQDKKYNGEPCELIIGNGNVIREFCTFNVGTPSGHAVTRIGDDNWFMAYVHIAHDCVVGSHTIFANNAQLAGHVQVHDWVILGGFTGVRQFIRIGAHGMTAGGTILFADQPPFVMSQGQPGEARSMNYVGLKRRGFSQARIDTIKAMHKLLYRQGLSLENALAQLPNLAKATPEAAQDVVLMQQFLQAVPATRGIVR